MEDALKTPSVLTLLEVFDALVQQASRWVAIVRHAWVRNYIK